MLKKAMLFSSLLSLLLLAGCASTGKSNKCIENEIKAQECQITDLQAENSQLQTKLQDAMNDLAVRDRRIADLEQQVAYLTDELANCKGARWTMVLENDVLFASGSNKLTSAGKKLLDDAAKTIIDKMGDKYLTIEGHTDTDPIGQSGWKDNWDLGSARAMAVMRYLISQGVKAEHCSAATYSMYQPVSETDKSKNRRAVLVLHTGWPRF